MADPDEGEQKELEGFIPTEVKEIRDAAAKSSACGRRARRSGAP